MKEITPDELTPEERAVASKTGMRGWKVREQKDGIETIRKNAREWMLKAWEAKRKKK